MRLFRHTLTHRLIAAGSDEVIGHSPLPSECSLNQVWCETHMIGTAAQNLFKVVLYGVDGRIIDDDDPGDVQVLDTEWDTHIIKDVDFASGAFTMDPGTSQSGPLFEPGEPNPEQALGLAFEEKNEFYKRRKMLSFAQATRGFVTGTPETYIPGDIWKFHSRKRFFVERMSQAILALSNPSLDDTTATAASSFTTEAKWMQMKYLEVVLEQAWMELMGLTESGAESPWEEAALLVEEILEPSVIEETAGQFTTAAWNVYCQMTWDITVPGRRKFNTISLA